MAAASASNPGVASRVRQWVLANFASSWFLAAPLLAAYAPRMLFQTYFNLFLRRHARRLLNVVDPYVSVDVLECPALARYVSSLQPLAETDTTYEEVKAYLSAAACSQDARELRAEGARHGDGLVISMRDGQDVADEFRGATLWWSSVVLDDLAGGQPPASRSDGQSRRCQRLTFHKRHRALVVDEYLPHVRRRSRDVLFSNRRRRLYTNNRVSEYSSPYHKSWSYVNFSHPTTFDTLAMEPARKKEIMDDLDAFRSSRDFYQRTGKPWKRGYLLYGTPGTGKSTMIAAMANHLNYDVYDVELTVVRNNNDLRRLLIETTSKSIIVIEDIDCSLDLTGDRRAGNPAAPPPRPVPVDRNVSAVTLSGLLNFIDGLWSACGGERVVVFTTNHVDKLDPALIRRGRMDMHIEMSYCGFEAFRTLARNYLAVDEHPLFGAVEELLREVQITPADVAECLMTAKRAGGGKDSAMEVLVEELKKKREEAKAAADAAATAAAAKPNVKAEEHQTAEANDVSKTDKCEERRAEEEEEMNEKGEEAKAAAAETNVKAEEQMTEANGASKTDQCEERRVEEEEEEIKKETEEAKAASAKTNVKAEGRRAEANGVSKTGQCEERRAEEEELKKEKNKKKKKKKKRRG